MYMCTYSCMFNVIGHNQGFHPFDIENGVVSSKC